MSQIMRDRLRQRFLDTRKHWVPDGPEGRSPGGAPSRRPYVRSDERAIGYVPYQKSELPHPLPTTLVAFYLPQFHTIPENDTWWGKGFTEWRNVTRALPQFEGHYQPKLPGDLGFYDLRNINVMHEQARLAREYGVSAFCFYFYWFGGKTLLEAPLRNWLDDKGIDFKFCLCWANEKWTRTWDGRGDEILIDQKHSPEDDIAFIEYVAEYMRDPRYLRTLGKPILLVYRPSLLKDIRATSERWRAWCRSNDIGEIHIAYVQSFDSAAPNEFGFDSAIAFPPNQTSLHPITDSLTLINRHFSGRVLDWRSMWAAHFKKQCETRFPLFQCVNPAWDNQARRPGGGLAYIHSAPRRYRDALIQAINYSRDQEHSLVFVNAWNEWAEGAILEPDARYGFAYLEATRKALTHPSTSIAATKTQGRPHVVLHAWYPDVLEEVLARLSEAGLDWKLVVTTAPHNQPVMLDVLRRFSFDYRFVIVENRGRDILPFLIAAQQLLDEGVDVVLKLHTKLSPHRKDGSIWRNELLDRLIGGDRASRNLSSFLEDPSLGLISPSGHTQSMNYYWGANEDRVNSLLDQIGVPDSDLTSETFVSGSMFWVRLESLRLLLDADLAPSDFDDERGQIDGTLAHAIERIFKLCIRDAGYKTLESPDISGDQQEGRPGNYPYADRG
ncbi:MULTISPECIES: glycoside hydrolase family 99-like domain-containing protein [unclassified Pseudoxanthomonas]|uniref:glycoside hydrolase family 99-like domain-containing protein n=1 Tax=unclassified Pseudoxanthomonas TaxID=2645906 RepID=UPI0030783A8F